MFIVYQTSAEKKKKKSMTVKKQALPQLSRCPKRLLKCTYFWMNSQ